MATFVSHTVSPSNTYGRDQSSSTVRTTIHAPHETVENASSRLISGEARSSSSLALTPTQNRPANRIPRNTIALPRSGWMPTSTKGMPTRMSGGISSTRLCGGSRRAPR